MNLEISIIEIGKELGLEVEERMISVEEVVKGIKSGDIKEMFGCGTAVVVIPYKAIGNKDELLELPILDKDKCVSLRIKERLVSIQNGSQEDPFGWRVKV